MDASRPETALGDLEGAARSQEDVRRRDAHVGEGHLAVAERLIEIAHGGEHPVDLHAGGVDRDEDHGVPRLAVGLGVGDAHEDQDLAVGGVPDTGGEPLGAVDDHVVAVEHGRRRHVGGIRRRDGGLGHAEGAANVGPQQRLQPALALLLGAVTQQDFHVPVSGALQLKMTGDSADDPIASAIGA